jgi:hypothetical protein
MGYIIKNTSGLINTKITDVGRRRISEGNFNISLFQVGDSEVSYNTLPSTYNLSRNFVLEPEYNSQNNTGAPQSNKQNVKYSIYVDGTSGNTYGIPFLTSKFDSVFNAAPTRGFFNFTTGSTYFSAQTSTAYTISSNYIVELSGFTGGNTIQLFSGFCSQSSGTPSIGDILTIYYDTSANCGDINGYYPVLTYRIQDVCLTGGTILTLDRDIPNFADMGLGTCFGRALIYPSGMTVVYDSVYPDYYWNYYCQDINVNIWNMNIPWSENPAGLFSTLNEDYTKFGSIEYLGTKEYLGYGSTGGTLDTSFVSYNNSMGENIIVTPTEQKAIAIIHYTNNSIDNPYGEKFAMEPYDSNAIDTTGQARNFKLDIPWVMWHKGPLTYSGLTLYVDPPNNPNNFKVEYIKSTKNPDFNYPGIRYFHLWDLYNNRVGKVFPDSKIIVIDDEELIAAMSYKSNRNWTLPAPKISLITPNVCDSTNSNNDGILTNSNEYMYVTYRFDCDDFTNSLHCNYYQKIQGPDTGCTTTTQNISVQFGGEFQFMQTGTTVLNGYWANKFKVLCQKVIGDVRPDPTQWREIDYTNIISGSSISGYINPTSLITNTFVITPQLYNSATIYDLNNYITLPQNGQDEILNFGDEYYFYGNISTDIQATIYEMRFECNLPQNQFQNTSNPTWSTGKPVYITEIGLYNSDKELMVISKLLAPEKRQGIQQFLIKLDF